MKSFFAYLFVFALVGGAMSARLRRKAPSAPGLVAPAGPKYDGLNLAISAMIYKLKNPVVPGTPADPTDINKVVDLCNVLELLGGKVSEDNELALADLLSPPPAAEPDSPPA